MILIIGGAWQGKKRFALEQCSLREEELINGETCEKDAVFIAAGITHFETYLKRFPVEEGQADAYAAALFKKNPGLVILANELGCGIVPVDAQDRAWREMCGRVNTQIAALSEQVYRVICGIGVRIK